MRRPFCNFIKLTIFSYLPLKKVLTDIRPLSKKVKDILINSEIANVNKVYQWKIDANNDCLLHDSKL